MGRVCVRSRGFDVVLGRDAARTQLGVDRKEMPGGAKGIGALRGSSWTDNTGDLGTSYEVLRTNVAA